MSVTRISELPRRDWRARAAPYVEPLSALLRTDPAAKLRLVQAAALLELAENDGVFVNGRVGVGKTLAAALAPAMFVEGAHRALVLVPGSMREATNEHFAKLRTQWKLPADTLLRSYSYISNMPRKGESLEDLFGEGRGPTMIICDEADKVRNIRTAACGRQIADYMQGHPECIFVVVTGTCDVEGLTDYGHLLDWCLRDRSPLPRTAHELQDWSDVVDKGDMRKAQWICQDLGIDQASTLKQIRAAYRDRLTSTPGVIIEDSPFEDVPLTVTEHCIDPGCDADFTRLRELGQRPDGADLAPGDEDELTSIWPVARRMGRGLCYVWENHDEWTQCLTQILNDEKNTLGCIESRIVNACARTTEKDIALVKALGSLIAAEQRVDGGNSKNSTVSHSSNTTYSSPSLMVPAIFVNDDDTPEMAAVAEKASQLITTISQGSCADSCALSAIERLDAWVIVLMASPRLLSIFKRVSGAGKPPREWMKARSAYFSWVRNGDFLTERVARDWAEEHGGWSWIEWQAVKDTYTPQTRVLWLSDVVLDWCAEWGLHKPGLIWVDDPPFGEELARRTGWTYYGAGNRPRIEDAPGDRPAIASPRAHGTGKNLQFQWSRMLFVAPPNTSAAFEQRVGRLHREGQVHPVHVDILLTCHEDFGSVQKVLRGARRTAQSLYAQKAETIKWPRAKRLAGPAFER